MFDKVLGGHIVKMHKTVKTPFLHKKTFAVIALFHKKSGRSFDTSCLYDEKKTDDSCRLTKKLVIPPISWKCPEGGKEYAPVRNMVNMLYFFLKMIKFLVRRRILAVFSAIRVFF